MTNTNKTILQNFSRCKTSLAWRYCTSPPAWILVGQIKKKKGSFGPQLISNHIHFCDGEIPSMEVGCGKTEIWGDVINKYL